jgi:hypothetical protein
MEPLTDIDRGKRKGMTVDEFMALNFPSDSDDGPISTIFGMKILQ